MEESDYYMKKTKKMCPVCIMHTGDIPLEAIKLCSTHKDFDAENVFLVRKGDEYMTQKEAINYKPFSSFPTKLYKKGGWRKISKEKKND